MKNLKIFRNAILTTVFGALVLVGTALTANAQYNSNEYRQWQRAQMEAQQRYNDYLRSRSPRDYRQWQEAQAKAQREQMQYQTWASRNHNNGYNNGYYTGRNNGYNNSGYYNNVNREAARNAIRSGYRRIPRGREPASLQQPVRLQR